MANRTPRVLAAGEDQQLQAGDTLSDTTGTAYALRDSLTTNVVPKFDGTKLVDSNITQGTSFVDAPVL